MGVSIFTNGLKISTPGPQAPGAGVFGRHEGTGQSKPSKHSKSRDFDGCDRLSHFAVAACATQMASFAKMGVKLVLLPQLPRQLA